MYEKFCAPSVPRPPLTMMSASAIDSSPASGTFVSITFAFGVPASSASSTTSASVATTLLGRERVRPRRGDGGICGNFDRREDLARIHGRRAWSLPSASSRRSTSEATPTFSRAATRGARSRPFDVPPNSTIEAPDCLIASTTAAV